MAALQRDLNIDQGADWPGEAFYIVDSLGAPKTLDPATMSAYGVIGHPGRPPLFEWLWLPTDPTALVPADWPVAASPLYGAIALVADTVIPSVTAAQNLLWPWANAPYQLYLFDPAAPPADRRTRLAVGSVYLDRYIGR